MSVPPVTGSVTPVIKPAASDAKKNSGVANILGLANTSDWDRLGVRFLLLVRQRVVHHRGLDGTRSNGIDSNAQRSHFIRHVSSEC